MKKWISYGVCIAILAGAAGLTISAPDWLSIIIVGAMMVIMRVRRNESKSQNINYS